MLKSRKVDFQFKFKGIYRVFRKKRRANYCSALDSLSNDIGLDPGKNPTASNIFHPRGGDPGLSQYRKFRFDTRDIKNRHVDEEHGKT